MTLLKAYYIIFSYMHLKDEKKGFQLTLGFLLLLLVYFVTLMMIEGLYQENVRLIFPSYLISDAPAFGL
jgi:cytochrome c oxidase subunit IV